MPLLVYVIVVSIECFASHGVIIHIALIFDKFAVLGYFFGDNKYNNVFFLLPKLRACVNFASES